MIEKMWYESSPIVYALVSVYFLLGDNKQAGFFGLILLIVTALIVLMRMEYRSTQRKKLS